MPAMRQRTHRVLAALLATRIGAIFASRFGRVQMSFVPSRVLRCKSMLKQRGSWKTWVGGKPGLWYFVSEAQRKTADHPHPAALVIGALSPLLAIVIISLRSLSTSQMSMKVSQRAYVAAEQTEFKASFGANGFRDGPIGNDEIAAPRALLSSTLRNLGNTPATILDLHLENGHGYSVKRVAPNISTLELEDIHQFPKELPS